MNVEILMTKDYNQFKILGENRTLSPAHVHRMVKSLRKKSFLADRPLIVNDEMEVLDGQHRLAAARLLDLPVYYKKALRLTKHDITHINSVSLKWSKQQYLDMFLSMGLPHYERFKQFMEFSRVSNVASNISMLKMAHTRGGQETYNFIDGNFVYPIDDSKAIEIAKQLHDYEERGYDFWDSVRFVCAVVKANKNEKYSHEKMMKKLEMQPRTLVKSADYNQYLDLMMHIYNYKSSKELLYFK